MEVSKQTVKRSKNTPVIGLEKGRIPPQATDLEEAVLGALMIDKKAVDDVIDLLVPEVFYNEKHVIIFEAILQLFKEGKPIDLLTVSAKLRENGTFAAVGDYYLISLTQKVASSANVEFHTRIVIQKYIQRKLISISSEIIEDCYDETKDVIELLDNTEAKLFEVTQGNLKKGSEDAGNLVKQAIQNIEKISNQKGMSGIPTGFTKLDELTSGWQPSDLVILAARPGMGKTAFVMSMAKNMAIDFDIPAAIFSLEMSSVQLITRMISSETGLSSEKLRKGNLEPHEWEQLNSKVKNLAKAPIFIDDTPSLSIFDLRAKARRLYSQHGIKVIIIDYLQLMTAGSDNKKGGTREQEISTISRNLKALAKELNIPVIALSQLSRSVETRGGSKRPLLSDLRESGAIEQDADIVSFIFRPEYYGQTEWDDEEHTPCEGQGEFIVAKHRNGGLDNIRLKFIGHLAKFTNLESDDYSAAFESKMNGPLVEEDIPLPKGNPADAFGGFDDANSFDENEVPF